MMDSYRQAPDSVATDIDDAQLEKSENLPRSRCLRTGKYCVQQDTLQQTSQK